MRRDTSHCAVIPPRPRGSRLARHIAHYIPEVVLKRIPTTLMAAALLALAGCAGTQPERSTPTPDRRAPAASSALAPANLRAHLTAFAHDSMQGREAGTPGHDRAVEYLARHLERLGLQPAGEDGTFFQNVPLITNTLDRTRPLTIAGVALRPGADYAPIDQRTPIRSVAGAPVIYGGKASEIGALTREQAAGKFIIISAEPGHPIIPNTGPDGNLADAVGLAVTGIDPLFLEYADYLVTPTAAATFHDDVPPQPVAVLLPVATAEKLLGAALTGLRQGTTGATLAGEISYRRAVTPSRNVIAVLPGTDPTLRDEYVALGAHTDHMGIRAAGPVDHDSLRAVNLAVRARTAPGDGPLSPADRSALETEVARQRVGARPRPDSIFNGADDDGSGSIGLLALAEHFSEPARRPRRSLLFVWHTAEEKGLIGSEWFTDHPTVPLDAIVANINIDMIGRGGKDDIPGGGLDYLQLLGPKRLSTEFATLIERVNARRLQPFRIDEQYDAPGHPEQYYCRSDHWNYARYGIPVAFFSTGDHADYHQLTDEIAYIDFEHYARVVGFVGDVAAAVGNLENRPVVDQPKPDPRGECRQ